MMGLTTADRRAGFHDSRPPMIGSTPFTGPAPGDSPRAPMPMNLPPVGPPRARRLRLLQLREQALRPGPSVDVDAVAQAIARRARFTRALSAELCGESEGVL